MITENRSDAIERDRRVSATGRDLGRTIALEPSSELAALDRSRMPSIGLRC